MSALLDKIIDVFPADNDVGVPLKSDITITLSGLDYDTDSLKEGLFLEGPDTDQFVGPGLLLQSHPSNISQGDLDDFLRSPGYTGIVDGVVTVSGIAGNTVVTFSPTLPMYSLTDYKVNFTGVTDTLLNDIDGFVIFSFQTGTGSIETVPDTISSSVLSSGAVETYQPGVLAADTDPLEILYTTPIDDAVQIATDLKEIEVVFNKEIDPASIAASDIKVKTTAATDHPNKPVTSLGDLAKSITVDKNKLKIKI